MKNYRADIKELAKKRKSRCFDCNTPNPQWASISYGIFVCLDCAGIHRSYGTEISRIKSINMDHWNLLELKLIELGGNESLEKVFQQHNFKKEKGVFKNPVLIAYAKELRLKAAEFDKTEIKKDERNENDYNRYETRQSVSANRSSSFLPSESTLQEKITNTIVEVGKGVVKGAMVLKEKTILYGGKINENIVKPSIKILYEKTISVKKSPEASEIKDFLPNEKKEEDVRKWD